MALFDRKFKDYRFAEEINEKGKRTVVLDYIGNYFYFKDGESAAKARPFHIAYAVLMIICWFVPLSIRISAMWLAYISIPYVMSAIGIILYCRGVWVLAFKKEPFIRTDGDSLTFKLMVGAGTCFILGLVALVGTLVATFLGLLWWTSDTIIFLGICLVYILSALMAFRMRKDVDVVEKFRDSEAPSREDKFTEEEKKRLEDFEQKREEDRNKIREVQQKKLDDEKKIKEEIREINTAVDADYKEVEEGPSQ